jgi:hypothetical protein
VQTFIDTDLLDRLRVGPLASHLDAYVERIKQEGLLPSSVPMQMYAIARFSKWLEIRQLDLHRVDEPAVELFLQRDPAWSTEANLRLYGAFWRCCERWG